VSKTAGSPGCCYNVAFFCEIVVNAMHSLHSLKDFMLLCVCLFRLNNKSLYAVCHGLSDDEPHCVSFTDNEGNILSSFGGRHSGSGHEELNRPIHLAVDAELGILFVLDSSNNAVKILRLSDVKLLDVFKHPEMHDPRRLSIDSSARHMAVATEDGRVMLFSY